MKTKEVEVYVAGFTNRFVTVTGHVYQEGEIVEESDGLLWLLEKYLKREKQSKSTKQNFKSYLSDEEVIEKASNAKNNEKFLNLWAGKIKDYPSSSEADLALTSILAFMQVEILTRLIGSLGSQKFSEISGMKNEEEKPTEK